MACTFSGSSEKDFAFCVSYALSRLKKENFVLKPEQSAVLESIFQRKDVFVWFPTGYGKSICYQALPFMFDRKLGRALDKSVVLVVSPLVSLMIDQVTSLRSVGVGAAIMSAGHAERQLARELLVDERDVERGMFSLLFGSPEAIIGSERWRQLLLGDPLCRQIVAVAVDEAHCVYKWYAFPFQCVLHFATMYMYIIYIHTHNTCTIGVQSLGSHLVAFMSYVL